MALNECTFAVAGDVRASTIAFEPGDIPGFGGTARAVVVSTERAWSIRGETSDGLAVYLPMVTSFALAVAILKTLAMDGVRPAIAGCQALSLCDDAAHTQEVIEAVTNLYRSRNQ